MNLSCDIQVATESDEPPDPEQIEHWLRAALVGRLLQGASAQGHSTEVCVRIVDREESQTLNHTYRHIDRPTNVLSFPTGAPTDIPHTHLGDIVICAPVVAAEAAEQGKPVLAHWAHMVVHGALHLLGYDHIESEQAKIMETLETDILAGLNFPAPYSDRSDFSDNSLHPSSTANTACK